MVRRAWPTMAWSGNGSVGPTRVPVASIMSASPPRVPPWTRAAGLKQPLPGHAGRATRHAVLIRARLYGVPGVRGLGYYRDLDRQGTTVAWHMLVHLLRRHRPDDSINKATGKLIRADVAVIDDVGRLPVSADAADALFQVIVAAYEKRSIAISSNIRPSGSTS